MNYYNEIKNKLIDNEVYKRVKDYYKNRNDLNTYYEVGKLLIEAQGGEERAKYGDRLIKEYSERLYNELGKKYDITTLKRYRQFYLKIEKGAALRHQLSWTHYRELLTLDNINELNYYVKITIEQNLSYRQLREKIKTKEYQRLDDNTKLKLINNEDLEINDNVKNPIVIYNKNNLDKNNISEKVLKNLILEDLDNFLKELGNGFCYIENEYKIKIGSTYNYIDKNIKTINQDKTIGIIISRRDNHYYIEYSSDNRIYTREYIIS